jgi:polyribonucleotide nucleotidyltransferase
MKTAEKKQVSMQWGDSELTITTGHVAFQAKGAVTVQYGDTIVLATAGMSDSPREGVDFFPMMVDFEEKWYASGKISGSKYVKREGRPSDDSILSSRLIDRPLRPLFPKGMANDVQIICSVISSDRMRHPATLGMIGASAALMVSGMPFGGPIAGVRVGRKDGNFILNPTYDEIETGELDLVVAGTKDAVMMVEAGAKEIEESVMLEAIQFAHENIKKVCALQEELVATIKPEPLEAILNLPDESVKEELKKMITDKQLDAIYADQKHEVYKRLGKLQDEILEKVKDKIEDTSLELWTKSVVKESVDKIFKDYMRANILKDGKRIDGRSLTDVRPLTCSVGMLPRPHGTGLFQRGETQIMSVLTLASPGKAQVVESMDLEYERRYMHHYNFPPYSVGEVKPLRSTGRREIGHGFLAERALMPVLPTQEQFPYTIRVVSETLACNGSSSMGSVCGSTLALMDGGVPITAPVVGIAMGLVTDGKGINRILTDIQGLEDFAGDMDFKVTGTEKGITALQMDIKVKGISIDLMREAMDQAKVGQKEILTAMLKAIAEPRKELSKYAPLISSLQILPDQIGMVIGKGGETIQEITKECGVEIDIEDSGLVTITAPDQESGMKAKDWIGSITYMPKAGDMLEGEVVRITDFGAFVELTRNIDGLVHISEITEGRVNNVNDVLQMGQSVKVKVKHIDDQGRIALTMKGIKQN